MNRFVIVVIMISFFVISCPLPDDDVASDMYISSYLDDIGSQLDYRSPSTDWTVMYYVDADNDLESYLLDDMYELSQGLESAEMMNVIALVDRIDGYSSDETILGSDFSDTRLFRIGADEIYDLSGYEYFPDIGTDLSGEYNMGDAETLKSFIEYCKEYYPADNYALIFSNHGGGVKGDGALYESASLSGGIGNGETGSLPSKAVCYDYSSIEGSSYDCLYTAELTDVLDSSHSVDLMVYDACLMGLLEVVYQYRPGRDEFTVEYTAASVPTVWGYGLPYDLIFDRISENNTGGTGNYSSVVDGSEYETQYYDPSSLTAEQFGLIIAEEQERDTQQISGVNDQSFALYDGNEVETVATMLDEFAAGSGYDASDMDLARNTCVNYAEDYPISYPFYDLYDFAEYTADSDFINAVDDMVVASFGGEYFTSDFSEGQEGLGFFFTIGEEEVEIGPPGNTTTTTVTYWDSQWWYTGEDTNAISSGSYYGKLDFCSADDDGVVDGWFELLQSLHNPYDPQEASDTDYDDYDYYHPGRY